MFDWRDGRDLTSAKPLSSRTGDANFILKKKNTWLKRHSEQAACMLTVAAYICLMALQSPSAAIYLHNEELQAAQKSNHAKHAKPRICYEGRKAGEDGSFL